MVVDPGMTHLERGQLLSEEAYFDAIEEYGDEFEALMGAEAIQGLLREINLEDRSCKNYVKNYSTPLLKPRLKKLRKRLKIMEAFLSLW